jgi:hypothetical protein
MFDKLAKDSIQKIMQNNFCDSSSDSDNNGSQHNIDEIINSDPHQLILNNSYPVTSDNQDADNNDDNDTTQEQPNEQLGDSSAQDSSVDALANDFDKLQVSQQDDKQDSSNSQDSSEVNRSQDDQEPQPAATGNARKQHRDQADDEQAETKQKEDYK